ncbi:MAG: 3-deoxy-8-phosphooctulonate synthase [Bacteroidales bacterium]|jgi:2-dehydro-3-deoxyphosphooctonate aldolase (KDO 8-P synthase)|nr:3-deoxy-8-phosphooctulonate synthase [Bacteroidales bacterium]MDD2571307.1 3-deoxy-8-phosphooctulonate synthase [Bacteroidales bacterium]MDD2814011.1 3-deoxy-8-phosphooctulonate synthase [Bacteroidales bacterium]MDD3386277.1 3-deoxy-8-phosphooctulonate synthase [Bacteroidales bacterium]MDD3812762.1 3-deoxy-8-phosphooctulonate synthase [Bacteroidales bacterium]
MVENLLNTIPNLHDTRSGNFLLIAGPCVVESREVTFKTARILKDICSNLSIPLIFKASYRKANRSKGSSFRGIGDQEALEILAQVREELSIPVITDVHETGEVDLVASMVDVLQIPAFLCRQTDLIIKAAQTGKPLNLKKGQFLSPQAMQFVCDKAASTGNHSLMITERGTSFGYGDLIVDFRGIPLMKSWGYPVILDITHSLQKPNQESGVTGGEPALIETIARAGIAAGIDGIFMETHPDPRTALSDGSTMLPLDQAGGLIERLLKINQLVKSL